MIDLYPAVHPGCTDGACLFRDNSKGMRTNGGCNCERDLSRGNPTGREAGRLIRMLRAEAVRARASELALKKTLLRSMKQTQHWMKVSGAPLQPRLELTNQVQQLQAELNHEPQEQAR